MLWLLFVAVDQQQLVEMYLLENLKILLALGKKYSETGSLNGEPVTVTYYNGSTFETITVNLTRDNLNKYRITTAESTDKDNTDVIKFIRDNIFVAKINIGG